MSLRERRRRQTALEIQAATLALAREHGFEQITTEAIAQAAGISPRTFFNYYPYKEAAVLGPPREISPEAIAAFTASDADLSDDLAQLFKTHLRLTWEGRIETLRAMIELTREHPRIMALHQSALFGLRETLQEVIGRRLPDDPVLSRLLALLMLDAARVALEGWLSGDETLEAQIDAVFGRLPDLGQILTRSGGRA
ncbi:TetR/AcrR family transcriptional regulator [Halodurantibacterium flavum]|uniref:TetR/AcrR family transcriptional regulator n=1 Tax=Halodurantibacterium flavum TaxID=1382802 RepID=A0ABW4S6K1_9RHOB